MDFPTFAAKLSQLSRFPQEILAYAKSVGERQDDAGRSALMANLEREYTEYVALDDWPVRREKEMVEELVQFRKTNFTKLQKMDEAFEHEQVETLFDDQFDAADKEAKAATKKKSNKKK